MSKPVCTIIAGVNGAGKTTFALDYFSKSPICKKFINADLIAFGLSPIVPNQQQIKKAVICRENFAFETSLSSKIYLKLINYKQMAGLLS